MSDQSTKAAANFIASLIKQSKVKKAEDLSLTLLQKVEMADNGAGLLIIDAGLK